MEGQHLARGQPVGVAEQLGQVAHPAPGAALADRPAQQLGRACAGTDQPQQQLDRGRLAGPVGPQEAQALPALDRQAQVAQRLDPAVALGQPARDDRLAGH